MTGCVLSALLLLQSDGDLERLRRGVLADREKPDDRIGAFEVSERRERTLKIDASRHEYTISMGGTADMRNTLTRSHGSFDVAFQPNLSLAISNTGKVPVVNPRVVVNDRRKWWNMESLLAEILAGAKDDQEKALRIWDFVRKNRHHDSPIFVRDELHDPVKMLNAYGGGLCDDSGSVGCSLLYHAGIGAGSSGRPKIRALHGHVMVEAFVNGAHQFLDIDQDVFYLDRENERIVSGDELARDHDLAKREHTYGPVFKGWETGVRAASLFGRDDGQYFRAVRGHRIDMTLRPGETIVYRWDNNGKYPTEGARRRSFWGTSKVIYAPPPDAETLRRIEMKSPYPLCGGTVRGDFGKGTVSVSLDGTAWKEVWAGTGRCDVELDEALEVKKRPAKYRYYVRVSGGVKGVVLSSDIMTSPHSLPALDLGENRVVYTDETGAPHQVTVTHRWRESGNATAPEPPAGPSFPAPDSVVRTSTFAFRWPKIDGADRYHLLVSRTKDMRLPYRPSFDIIVKEPSLASPHTGLFSPDTDYFWRVRARGKEGIWGEWSPVWRFRWDGPRVPVELERRTEPDGRITLSWKPNPRGPRPVAYRVYGSDERGFTVSDTPYELRGLGRQQANFLAETNGTRLTIISSSPDHPVMNRCYYRVVAVDRNGTRGGPSDYLELPHPYVTSAPRTRAAIGRPYRYELKVIRSLGDLQCRYLQPRLSYRERESYSFRKVEGPKWLSLDGGKGILSGTPGPDDEGAAEVEILVTRHFPHEVGKTKRNGGYFSKSGKGFQASHTHRYTLRVGQESIPTLGFRKRELKDHPNHKTLNYVRATFPDVPGFTCESWCYESGVELEDHRKLGDGRMVLRHRHRGMKHLVIVTTVTPEPGAVEFVAKAVVDGEGELPTRLPNLNLCFQLRTAEGFHSKPDPYPEFVKRCFIFTDKGTTFLLDTHRRKSLHRFPADDKRNSPPWVQMYVGVWRKAPGVQGKGWAEYSTDRYTVPVIGTVSRDRKHLVAIANGSAGMLCNAWHDCLHNNPQWAPSSASPAERRWRLKVYVMKNDPEALRVRVAKDFPEAVRLKENRVSEK